MQISTVNNTFNIKTFACKNIWYVNSHLQRKKSPSQVWFDILVSVDQSVLALWHSSPIPRLCPLAFGVLCEEGANVEHPNCLHYNLTYFPGETLGTSVKTASAAQALLLPAASPFSPCNTLCCSATPRPTLPRGC